MTHSTEALEVINKFYDTEYVIYVEGEDDVLFWGNYIKKIVESVKIENAGGKENLEVYIERIIDDGAKIIVARDNDYSDILERRIEHPLVMYTYGYSIENTLYCNYVINNIIRKYCKTNKNSLRQINEWKNRFIDKIKKLIVYDIAKEKFSKSTMIIGKSCNRFLSSNSSAELDDTKIDEFVKRIESSFNDEEITYIEKKVENYEKNYFHLIKGHFITSSIINLIKSIVKKDCKKRIQLNTESLYSEAIDYCHLIDCNCKQKEYYLNEINDAIQYLHEST
jgi:malate/lactate dehydrogenase